MTPHGQDLLDSSGFSAAPRDLLDILHRLREVWPDAVVVRGMDPDETPPTLLSKVALEFIPTTSLRELFVFKSLDSHTLWMTEGWTEQGDGDLLYFIASPTHLTVVGAEVVSLEVSAWAHRLAEDLKVLSATRQPGSA